MSERYAKYDKLKFDYPADRVLRITFDRPETFNSVDAETHTQMTDMWIDIDRDPDINAVIVTGAGKAASEPALVGRGGGSQSDSQYHRTTLQSCSIWKRFC